MPPFDDLASGVRGSDRRPAGHYTPAQSDARAGKCVDLPRADAGRQPAGFWRLADRGQVRRLRVQLVVDQSGVRVFTRRGFEEVMNTNHHLSKPS